MTKDMRPNQFFAIKHPKTGTEYWPPETRVWRFQPPTMGEHITNDNIIWPDDQPDRSMTRPRFKTRFRPGEDVKPTPISTWIDTKPQRSVKDSDTITLQAGLNQEATKELKDLFGDQLLEYPKPVSLMKTLVRLATCEGELILDFFAGSCTTAQAVLELNREDGGNRRFVMVQLPEPTGNKKFPTIAAIGKERIRRVIARLKNETGDLMRSEPEDLGFKVFQLAESHFQSWAGVPEREPARYHETMGLFLDPLRDGWTPEGVLWEVAVKEGYGLNSRIEQLACPVNAVYRVTDPEKDPPQSFRACLDDAIHPDIAKALELGANDLFVCRDRALDDTLAANLALQCRLKTI